MFGGHKVTKAEERSFIYGSRISKLSLSAESVANNNTNNQVLIIGCWFGHEVLFTNLVKIIFKLQSWSIKKASSSICFDKFLL